MTNGPIIASLTVEKHTRLSPIHNYGKIDRKKNYFLQAFPNRFRIISLRIPKVARPKIQMMNSRPSFRLRVKTVFGSVPPLIFFRILLFFYERAEPPAQETDVALISFLTGLAITVALGFVFWCFYGGWRIYKYYKNHMKEFASNKKTIDKLKSKLERKKRNKNRKIMRLEIEKREGKEGLLAVRDDQNIDIEELEGAGEEDWETGRGDLSGGVEIQVLDGTTSTNTRSTRGGFEVEDLLEGEEMMKE